MNRNKQTRPWSGFDPIDFSILALVLFTIVGFVSVPVTGYFRAVSLQQILNTECKGNYSFVDVALNGNELVKVCRINNQTITIK